LRPFCPIVANHHFLTVAGNFWPRRLDTERYPVESKLYRTEPGVQVLVQSQRPAGEPLGEICGAFGEPQAAFAALQSWLAEGWICASA